MAKIRSFRETGERYPVLRVLAMICNLFGLLMLTMSALCILVGILSLSVEIGPGHGLAIGVVLIWSLGLFAGGIQSFAMGSFFRLAIHVEENTRATAQALDRLRSSLEPKPEIDPRNIFLS